MKTMLNAVEETIKLGEDLLESPANVFKKLDEEKLNG